MVEREANSQIGAEIEDRIDLTAPAAGAVPGEPAVEELLRDDPLEPEQIEQMREREKSARIGTEVADAIQWNNSAAAADKETVESKA